MKSDPRIPEPVQPIVKDYLQLTEQRLVGLISGSCVAGSIALGEFKEYFSFVKGKSTRPTACDSIV